jgi:hypothetical protein
MKLSKHLGRLLQRWLGQGLYTLQQARAALSLQPEPRLVPIPIERGRGTQWRQGQLPGRGR